MWKEEVELDYCGKSKLMGPPLQEKWPQANRHQSQRAMAKEFFSTGSPEEITALSHSIINLVLERRKNARASSSNQQITAALSWTCCFHKAEPQPPLPWDHSSESGLLGFHCEDIWREDGSPLCLKSFLMKGSEQKDSVGTFSVGGSAAGTST